MSNKIYLPFWQVHLPAPKRVDRPHYEVTVPNEMHQFDLLYITLDSLYGNEYKYILAGIDAASRFKVARPLRTKQARDVAEMIADIYKVGPLKFPKIFQCDNGSEFKGDVTKMLEKNEVRIQRVTTKYKHTHTAFVEALNKILAERLFKVQDAQELNDPEKVSASWVKHLYGLVDELNHTTTEMIGMKPEDAIKLDEVPPVKRERPILQKRNCLKMDCIRTYYNPVKNMMIKDTEQLIGFGLRELTD